MKIDNSFCINIDSSQCTSIVSGGDFVGKKKFYDCWRYDSLQFEGGNIYALVGEFGEGCMYLSYLLGGKVDFGDLKIYINVWYKIKIFKWGALEGFRCFGICKWA